MPSRRATLVAFVVATVAGLALLVVYAFGGQAQLEGLLWFYALAGLGVGIVTAAIRYLPHDISEEERHPVASTPEELEEALADFRRTDPNNSEDEDGRRSVLRMFGAAIVAIGAALIFPIRSLGPRPERDLRQTPFRRGVRLVTVDGEPVRAGQLGVGEVVTVFPEGHTKAADAPTLLIGFDQDRFIPVRGREEWVAGGLVAYSKICTHAACAVGLYENQTGLLLCPCHQSTFDVNDGARPAFGPATRPLPQLPIAVDEQGFVIARSDYTEPVGPGFWDRARDL